MRFPSIVGAVGALAVAAALGCGPKVAEPTQGAIPRCINLWPQGAASDTVRVALFDNIDPSHAPVWRNDAERLVFRHLYETLPSEIKWPCVRPSSLADPSDVSRNSIVFTIRESARFWDGTPVRARDIVASVGALDPSFGELDSVVALDERRVKVMAHGINFVWLESPTRAVVRSTGSSWPMGTGPYRVEADDGFEDGVIVLRPVAGHGPVIRFEDARGVDARDLLDRSTQTFDIIMSSDRKVRDYAASSGQYGDVYLGVHRAYLLLSFDRARAIEQGYSIPDLRSLLNEFARDVVRSTYAVPIPEVEWTRALQRCNADEPATVVSGATRSRRIVYDNTDPTSRDLADRIASLAASDPTVASALPGIESGAKLTSVGLTPSEFMASLARGSEFAYVVALRYDLPDVCRAVSELTNAAPWLGNDTRLTDKVLPLVKTMLFALVAKPAAGYGFDISLDGFQRAIITEPDLTPYP
jgi:hypothetical protein